MNWADFFHMGGYAFHVWTSWGLTLFVLFIMVLLPKQRNKKIRTEIERQIQREQKLDNHSQN